MTTTQSVKLTTMGGAKAGSDFALGDFPIALFGFPGLNAAYWQTYPVKNGDEGEGTARGLEKIWFTHNTNQVSSSSVTWNAYNPLDGNVPSFTDDGDQGIIILSDSAITWPIWTIVPSFSHGAFTTIPIHGSFTPIGEARGRPYVYVGGGDALVVAVGFHVTMTTGWTNSFEIRAAVSFRAYNTAGTEDVNTEVELKKTFTTQTESNVVHYVYAYYIPTDATPCFVSVIVDSIAIHGASNTLTVAKPQAQAVTVQARLYRNINPTASMSDQTKLAALWAGTTGSWVPQIGADKDGFYGTWRLVTSDMFRSDAGGDPLIGRSVRTVGSSLLLTNMSPEAAKGGNLFTGRLKTGLWYQATMKALANCRGYSATMLARDGCYTFTLPEEEKLRFYQVTPANFDVSTRFNLDDLRNSYVHFIVIGSTTPLNTTGADIIAGTNLVAPSTYRLTFDEQFEFETSSRRYYVTSPQDWIQDLQMVMRMFNENAEFFYENPNHLERLYSLLRGVASKAWRGVTTALPYVAPAITAANPELAPLMLALKGLAMATSGNH